MAERKILIPVPGRNSSDPNRPYDRPLKRYLDDLCEEGDKVHIVRVPEYTEIFGGDDVRESVPSQENECFMDALNEFRTNLRSHKVDCRIQEVETFKGAGKRIVEKVKDEKINFIIMGGLGTKLDSVSDYVIANAPPPPPVLHHQGRLGLC